MESHGKLATRKEYVLSRLHKRRAMVELVNDIGGDRSSTARREIHDSTGKSTSASTVVGNPADDTRRPQQPLVSCVEGHMLLLLLRIVLDGDQNVPRSGFQYLFPKIGAISNDEAQYQLSQRRPPGVSLARNSRGATS